MTAWKFSEWLDVKLKRKVLVTNDRIGLLVFTAERFKKLEDPYHTLPTVEDEE